MSAIGERDVLLKQLGAVLARLEALGESKMTMHEVAHGGATPASWSTDRELFTKTIEGERDLSEFIGRPIGQVFAENAKVIEFHRRVLEGETVYFRSRIRDTAWFCHLTPVRTAAGDVEGTIGFGFRVEEQQEPLDQVSLARRLHAIISAAPVGIAVLALDGRMVECNPALARMLDYSPEEIRRLGPVAITHPDDLAADVQLYRE